MRRARWACVCSVGWSAALAGCFPWQTLPGEGTTVGAAKGPPLVSVAADALFVQSVLIERPVGDPFLDRDLWEAGEPVGGFDSRALLAENGLRAVAIGGNLPPEFAQLLGSDLSTVDPRLMTFSERKSEVVPTNGPLEACSYGFQTELGGTRSSVSLWGAECGWHVRPEVRPDGRVRLACEPRLQHGERRDWLRPNADGTRFTMTGEMALEKYPGLAFEASLGPKEYLLIGGFADRPETLGGALFRLQAEGRTRQRVLVLRAGKGGEAPPEGPAMGPKPRGGPSIAVEAARGRTSEGGRRP